MPQGERRNRAAADCCTPSRRARLAVFSLGHWTSHWSTGPHPCCTWSGLGLLDQGGVRWPRRSKKKKPIGFFGLPPGAFDCAFRLPYPVSMRLPHGIVAAALTAALVVAACGDSKTPVSPSQPAPAPTLQTVAEAPVSGPIADVTAGSTGTFNFPGQSVTFPAGTYNNLRFQWYSTTKEAVAFGRLYILTQEFLGLPGNLPNAPGLIAIAATIQAGEFVVEPAEMEFQGDRTYWFYGDTQGSFATSFDIDTYAPGIGYVTGIFSQPFRRMQASGRMVNGQFVPAPPGVTVDANFRLRGARVR